MKKILFFLFFIKSLNAQTLNLDTTKKYIKREFEKSLIIEQTKKNLGFKPNSFYTLNLRLFPTDRRLININNFFLKSIYFFNQPEKSLIINISLSGGFGLIETKSFKIF
jgi:hypothetical protein